MGDNHSNGNGSDFPIGIRNGLLSPEHRKAMGVAVWEFIWCVEHVTEEYLNREGEVRGKVLGGTGIELIQIARDLGMSESSIGDNLRRLEHGGYIARRRLPRGHLIEVRHSKKWPQQRFLRPNPSPPSNQEQERVGVPTSPTPGDSANRSIGDPVISPNGENANSPDHLFAETPIATNDIAMGSDKTMFPPAEEAAHATAVWAKVMAEAVKRLPSLETQLRGCQASAVDGNKLTVNLPADQTAAAQLKRNWQVLNDLLQQEAGANATLRFVNYEARAGP